MTQISAQNLDMGLLKENIKSIVKSNKKNATDYGADFKVRQI